PRRALFASAPFTPALPLAGRPRQHLAHSPALASRQRRRFDDQHLVALATLAALVVSHETAALMDPLAVERMLDEAFHLHHHGLGRLGRDHRALALLNSLPHLAPCSARRPPRSSAAAGS